MVPNALSRYLMPVASLSLRQTKTPSAFSNALKVTVGFSVKSHCWEEGRNYNSNNYIHISVCIIIILMFPGVETLSLISYLWNGTYHWMRLNVILLTQWYHYHNWHNISFLANVILFYLKNHFLDTYTDHLLPKGRRGFSTVSGVFFLW